MPTARLDDIEEFAPQKAPAPSSKEVIHKSASDEQDGAGTKPEEERHEWSSTQINVPEAIARAIQEFAAKIPEEQIGEEGREDESHVTVLYGIDTEDPDTAAVAFHGQRPIRIKFGTLSLFKNDDADVLKLDVDSPALNDLNEEIRGVLPHVDKQLKYVPHCTVAYLKPGEGDRYVGRSLPGATYRRFIADAVVFSSKDGSKSDIPLGSPKSERNIRQPVQPEPLT